MQTLTNTQRFILFNAWSSAIDRCHNPANTSFPDYGGRGIVVCERWRTSFDAFVADMGVRPADTSLDRIDVNKGYSPDNCRWADRFVQARNKRNTKLTKQDLVDIAAASDDGVRPEVIAMFYGVTGAYVRKLTAGRQAPVCKGVPGAKLTEHQVREMRTRYAAGESAQALAVVFNIQKRNAYNVVKGHTWGHVA